MLRSRATGGGEAAAAPAGPDANAGAGAAGLKPTSSGRLYNLLASAPAAGRAAAGVLRSLSLGGGGAAAAGAPPRPAPLVPVVVRLRAAAAPEAPGGPPQPASLSLAVPADASLDELAARVARDARLPPARQRLVVREARPGDAGGGAVGGAGALRGALRSLASAAALPTRSRLSRERLARSASEWLNFFLLPEAVGREVSGRGLLGWARATLAPRLAPPPPPHVAAVEVRLADGRRAEVRLNRRGASVARLRAAVERRTGLPPAEQRLCVDEAAPRGAAAAAAWAAVRALVAALAALAALWGALLRWALLGPAADDRHVRLRVTHMPAGGGGGGGGGGAGGAPGSGAAAAATTVMRVRRDASLAALQEELELAHGEVDIVGVVLERSPPPRAAS